MLCTLADVLSAASLPRPRGGARGELLQRAAADAYARLLQPAMARELRRRLTAEAEAEAASVFARNLRALLMQRPVRGMGALLGLDPGFKSGCKLAVVSECGAVLAHEVVHPHAPRHEREHARERIAALVDEYSVGVVAIGDGTASQESIELVSSALGGRGVGGRDGGVSVSVVHEAGASVLSVSASARAAEPALGEYAIGAASLTNPPPQPRSS